MRSKFISFSVIAGLLIAIYIMERRPSTPSAPSFGPAVQVDRLLSAPSEYPTASDPKLVGTYNPNTYSGAGYFYDEALEYRVWMHPECGAADIRDGDDYYAAFAQYERAAEFAEKTKGTEMPLVLVRQREWITEPSAGRYIPERGERITEWQVKWLLEGSHREANSILEFLKHPRPAREEPEDETCR